jgi:hypothetical protein
MRYVLTEEQKRAIRKNISIFCLNKAF